MRCLQCGKEIPEGRKFCNSSCSAKYNNVRRQRRPWTEEQKKKNRRRRPWTEEQKKKKQKRRKEVVCKYCGKPGKPVCEECRGYVQNVAAFTRLGILEGSLQDRFRTAIEILSQKYFEEKLGLQDLSKQTGLNQTTLRNLFKKADIQLRSIGEGTRVAIEEGRLVLDPSSHKFCTGTHISWQGCEYRYRSGWELKFMEELDEQKIPYIFEFKWIRYWNSEAGEERLALPDFYLPESNEIVELKSSYTIEGKVQEMKDKFKAYREQGYIPKLLLDWKYVDLNLL